MLSCVEDCSKFTAKDTTCYQRKFARKNYLSWPAAFINLSVLTNSNCDLRYGWRIDWPLDALDSTVEDAGYAVCLGKDGTIADAKTETKSNPHEGAGGHRRLGQDHERHGIARQYAQEQHVAKFPSGGHDDRRPIVAYEDACSEQRGEDAEAAEDERHQRPRVQPINHQRLQLDALRFVLVRCETRQARLASVVVNIWIFSTSHAHPAALILQERLKPFQRTPLSGREFIASCKKATHHSRLARRYKTTWNVMSRH